MRTVPLRLLAILLAFGLWFVVSEPRRERVSERAFAAPLAIVGLPRDMIVTTPVPDSVTVRLRGRVSDLRSLSSQALEVTIDASWAQPGQAVVTLGPQALNLPANIEVMSVDPNKLRFRVEGMRQRAVPIRPFLVGEAPRGYIYSDPSLVPDQALISGPASEIRKINEVATERIIMSGRTDTFTQTVAVVSDSPLVRVVQPLTTQVTVIVGEEVGPTIPLGERNQRIEASARATRKKEQ